VNFQFILIWHVSLSPRHIQLDAGLTQNLEYIDGCNRLIGATLASVLKEENHRN
jgi:hypothetical protein